MTEEAKSADAPVEQSSNSLPLNTIIGQKAGMTRIFDSAGNHIPVTVINLITNHVTQVKTTAKDGYEAYQIGYYTKRDKLVKKAVKGQLTKAGVDSNYVRFTEVKEETISSDNLGKLISVENFTPGMFIDVTGTSKGKGFQGQMKRHNFQGGPATHGSKFHRSGGSIGNRATPGKVWKNKRMPGHMGAETKTIQNVTVVEVNTEKNYMLIRGSVPGAKDGFVRIAKALKK